MAETDAKSGYCSETKIFHSLRKPLDLPPEDIPLTVSSYALSLQPNNPIVNPTAMIDCATKRSISYSEFIRQVDSLSFHLHSVVGIKKGDVAFLLCSNSVKVPIIYFSLMSLGVVLSPSNPMSTEAEILRQLNLCNPVVAFAVSSASAKLPNLKFGTIVVDSPDFDSVLATEAGEIDRVEVSQSAVAAIMYSSGTTGRVKGVMVTHRNMIANTASFYQHRSERRSSAPAVALGTVPYFHIFGFFAMLRAVAVSDCVVVMERFDLRSMMRAVDEFKVTHLTVVPPVVVAMVKGDAAAGCDLSSLETLGVGAAPLGKDVVAAFKTKFPHVVLGQGYGLTESTGPVTRAVGPEEGLYWGSAGRLVGSCEVKIIDIESGVALGPNQPGELWIKGPILMKGYLGDAEATAATLTPDGWLKTGDVCYVDEEGYFYVVDRLKELIKYKGYQVAPAELEQLLQSHPEISDAAVIPYPDEVAGEIPMAFVVRQPHSSINEAHVMEFVATQVSPYKKVRKVAFVNSIPKSPAGKILRKTLRESIASHSKL
uniref:4-coumarate--CoA ligase n=1 Tax=Kalanchoe fedtschenkoi TaxID=63787 RepID=A0A7N0UU74_KALFE